MAKPLVTRELVGKVVCSAYVTHQKVISYSWILAITRAYLPLKSTVSTTIFNRQKRSWNLSISLTSDLARSWILLWSQVFAWLVVIHSMTSYVIRHGHKSVALENFSSCKLLRSHTGNSGQLRPGRRSVANRSQSITGQSEVGRKCVMAVGLLLWFWGPSLCR